MLDRAGAYTRLAPPALSIAWRILYAARDAYAAAPASAVLEDEYVAARSRLLLHYAPIVKFVVGRYYSSRGSAGNARAYAAALRRVSAGIAERDRADRGDWTMECVALACCALTNLDDT